MGLLAERTARAASPARTPAVLVRPLLVHGSRGIFLPFVGMRTNPLLEMQLQTDDHVGVRLKVKDASHGRIDAREVVGQVFAAIVVLVVDRHLEELEAQTSRADERAWSWSPLGIGIAAPVQLPFMDSDVYGIRLGGFSGFNHDVYGLDAGVAEITTGDFAGVQAAAFTWTEGDVYGIQCGAFANVANASTIALQFGTVNIVRGDAGGLQCGVVNYDGSFAGVQVGGVINWNNALSYGFEIAPVNANQDEFKGWELGVVNYSDKLTGFSLGVVNVAYEVTGYQLGVVNACDDLHGFQLGLLNLVCNSKLPIMVIANASF